MSRVTRTVLLSVSLFLLAGPLVLHKPGLPPNLKADEPAYLMMAQSLVHDRDVRVEVADIDRLFAAFPYQPVRNLIVMSDDDWQTVYVGKPYLYSLAAAPLVALLGADGMLALNMLLLLAMAWGGTLYLARFNPDSRAALFAFGFFLLSAGHAYVYWMQPEVFNMAGVFGCLFFACYPFAAPNAGRLARRLAPLAPWLSAACLVAAAYNKPMYAAVALPVVGALVWRRQWRRLAAWCGGGLVAAGLIALLAMVLTGHPSAYLGVARQGVKVCGPGQLPLLPDRGAPAAGEEQDADGDEGDEEAADADVDMASAGAEGDDDAASSAPSGSWSWLLRVPTIVWPELFENVGYFFWGRHTGLFLYQPFALLALLLFLLPRRRRGALGSPVAAAEAASSSPGGRAAGDRAAHRLTGWLILAALAVVAAFFLLLIPYNWHGGGGFVGNRYFVGVYPAFFFLVRRIRPVWLNPVAYGAAGLLLAALLAFPYGAPVPAPTLQAHTRNLPLSLFPLEHSLINVPGYTHLRFPEGRLTGRADQALPQGRQLWIQGGAPAVLYLSAHRPLERLVFDVSSFAPANRITLAAGDARETVEMGFGKGPSHQRVELVPGGPTRVRSQQDRPVYLYRLRIEAAQGRIVSYERHHPPPSCPEYGYNAKTVEPFFVGAGLTFLGSGEGLTADVFEVEWGRVRAPRRMVAGETVRFPVQLVNRSAAPWRGAGAAQIQLSYHWLRQPPAPGELLVANGDNVVEWNGKRTPLPREVGPGEPVRLLVEVEAPRQPGRYTLLLDPVFEHVSWFSLRRLDNARAVAVEVVRR